MCNFTGCLAFTPDRLRGARPKRSVPTLQSITQMKLALTLCAILACGVLTLRAEDAPKKPHATPEEIFKKLDTNGDGFLSKEEYLASPRAKKDPAAAEKHYEAMDTKKDGKVTLEEFKAAMHHGKKPAANQ